MKVEVIQLDEELTMVALDGRLDPAGVQEIQLKFYGYTAARKKPTVVNMEKVEFLASLGIRMLIDVAKALKSSGLKLVLLKCQPGVEKSLRLTGLHVVLGLTQDEAEARELAGVAKG